MKNFLLILLIYCVPIINGLAQSNVLKETLVYAEKDGIKLHLDKYVDLSIPYEGKRPVFIYVHGGGFYTGSRVNALQIQYLKHFVGQGFVAIGIDYRLDSNTNIESVKDVNMNAISKATHDLLDATSFILQNAVIWNIEPTKVILSGGSAGAITCLNAVYKISQRGEDSKRLPEDFNYAGVISHAGAIIVKEDTLTWKKIPAPILFMHGNKDDQVPFDSYQIEENLYAGSRYISNQFIKMNAPHWLYEEDGADHIVALKPLQYNFEEIDAFIERFVWKGQKASVHTVWKDYTPGSMDKMIEIVPLYINGWGKTDDEVAKEKE